MVPQLIINPVTKAIVKNSIVLSNFLNGHNLEEIHNFCRSKLMELNRKEKIIKESEVVRKERALMGGA